MIRRKRRKILGGGMLTRSVTLTDAQIKAQTSGNFGFFEVVPAQGAGKLIHFISGIVTSDVSAAIYGTDASIDMAFIIDTNVGLDISNIIDSSGALSLLGAAGNGVGKYITFIGQGDSGTNNEFQFGPQADWVNKNLGFRISNKPGFADLTGGNAANTMKVTVFYEIVDV